jgi:uncharacterized DUF497 family protein
MRYDWSDKKNQLLRETRAVSFEQIIQAIADGKLVDVIENPNQMRYAGQVFLIVNLRNYIYIVAAVIDKDGKTCELKTIYPNRKYTAKYLGANR